MRDFEWMDQAACKGKDLKIFFPTLHQGRTPKGGRSPINEAVKICNVCPVKLDCARFNGSFPEHKRHGVWAGEYFNGASSHHAPTGNKHLSETGTEAKVRAMTEQLRKDLAARQGNVFDRLTEENQTGHVVYLDAKTLAPGDTEWKPTTPCN